MRHIRSNALVRFLTAFALIIAVFQQSLIPAGWMPKDLGGDGGFALELCSGESLLALGGHDPAATDDGQQPRDPRIHQLCPYFGPLLAVIASDNVLAPYRQAFHVTPARPEQGAFAYTTVPGPVGSRAPPALT